MSAPTRNIRHALKSFVPNWLADIPGLNTGFSVLFIMALMMDCIVEVMLQGLFAAWPGKGTASALPYIGRSRGLIRGEYDTDEMYAAKLRGWLSVWQEAGSDEQLARLLGDYFGQSAPFAVPALVRVWNRSGHVTSYDGTDVTVNEVPDWDWDELGFPERAAWWSDVFITVTLEDGRWPSYPNLGDPTWVSYWGNPTSPGLGHAVPNGVPDDVKVIVSVFKGAHTYVEALVFTPDGNIFNPLSFDATYPDGYWGNFSRNIAGTQTPARAILSPGAEYVRYWIPNKGG